VVADRVVFASRGTARYPAERSTYTIVVLLSGAALPSRSDKHLLSNKLIPWHLCCGRTRGDHGRNLCRVHRLLRGRTLPAGRPVATDVSAELSALPRRGRVDNCQRRGLRHVPRLRPVFLATPPRSCRPVARRFSSASIAQPGRLSEINTTANSNTKTLVASKADFQSLNSARVRISRENAQFGLAREPARLAAGLLS
jgi:hypothetical protein